MIDIPKAQRETELALAAVGSAITQWGQFEDHLCDLFAVCLAPSEAWDTGYGIFDLRTTSAVFFAVENFRSKLAMVNVAFAAIMEDVADPADLPDRWRKIHDKARQLSKRRNRLAHWSVGYTRSGALLRPAARSPAHSKVRGHSHLDLRRLEYAFGLLAGRCFDLTRDLAAHPELHSRFASLVARQMKNDARRHNQSALESIKHALSWPE
jgi:hypothetical protein